MSSPQINMELRKVGEYLPCPAAAIEWALTVQAAEVAGGSMTRIGEILIEGKGISRENLVLALERQRMDRLRGCSLLADCTDEELRSIGNRSDEIRLEPGEDLFTAGHRGDSIYIVLSGRMILWRGGEIQNEIPLGAALPGDVLGENDYFCSGTRCCSGCATEASVLLRVPYEVFPRPVRSGRKNLSLKLSLGSPADELATQIMQTATLLLSAVRADLFIRDLETGDFHLRIRGGGNLHELIVPPGTGVVGWVGQKRQIVNIADAYADVRFEPEVDIWTGVCTRTLLAAPAFNAQGKVIAVIEVINKLDGYFDSDDEALLHAFARQSAAAIDYCRTARRPA